MVLTGKRVSFAGDWPALSCACRQKGALQQSKMISKKNRVISIDPAKVLVAINKGKSGSFKINLQTQNVFSIAAGSGSGHSFFPQHRSG
jgi:hypothetical protein